MLIFLTNNKSQNSPLDYCFLLPFGIGIYFLFSVFSFLSPLPSALHLFSFNIAGKRLGTKWENWKLGALVRFWDYEIVIGDESCNLNPEYSSPLPPERILSSRENNIGLHCLLKFQSTFKTVDYGGKATKREKIQLSVFLINISHQSEHFPPINLFFLWIHFCPLNFQIMASSFFIL